MECNLKSLQHFICVLNCERWVDVVWAQSWYMSYDYCVFDETVNVAVDMLLELQNLILLKRWDLSIQTENVLKTELDMSCDHHRFMKTHWCWMFVEDQWEDCAMNIARAYLFALKTDYHWWRFTPSFSCVEVKRFMFSAAIVCDCWELQKP